MKAGYTIISIMYPPNFPAPGWGLDFLLPPFLVSRQEKEVSREEKEM